MHAADHLLLLVRAGNDVNMFLAAPHRPTHYAVPVYLRDRDELDFKLSSLLDKVVFNLEHGLKCNAGTADVLRRLRSVQFKPQITGIAATIHPAIVVDGEQGTWGTYILADRVDRHGR